jgi:hypothetical protein
VVTNADGPRHSTWPVALSWLALAAAGAVIGLVAHVHRSLVLTCISIVVLVAALVGLKIAGPPKPRSRSNPPA